jgi:hypothetical protein
MRDSKGRFIKTHAHHWLYESPNGTHSTAVCLICGDTLVSANSLPGLGSRATMQRLIGIHKMKLKNTKAPRATPEQKESRSG